MDRLPRWLLLCVAVDGFMCGIHVREWGFFLVNSVQHVTLLVNNIFIVNSVVRHTDERNLRNFMVYAKHRFVWPQQQDFRSNASSSSFPISASQSVPFKCETNKRKYGWADKEM